uniref:Poly [ADP-ribose] polymerase n=1 Tax=Scophthalmus maximus TaxID=52904 RepID=A0A8D3BUC2_SCOMX
MLKEISAFSIEKQPKHLKKVDIVLYSGDAQTIQVRKQKEALSYFQMEINSMTNHCLGLGKHETKMGSVTIQVVTGDITKETSEVIVNSSNEDFSLKSGVSKAILDAAGQSVEAECQRLGAQPNPGMITTQPGNLKCKKIVHLAGQTDPVKIRKSVKDALQLCVKNSHTSVSLPAIGTDVPVHWDPMPAKTSCQAVTLKPGAAEHTEILNLFQASCNRPVIKIERIQNPLLWKSLQIKKRDMEQRNGHQNNLRRLFHGTCHTTVNMINELGFNRSYAGKNAAVHGNGTYFAVNANYSASDTYSKPNGNGEKFMYLCQVLTGDFTKGQQNMIAPPAKGNVSVQKYDSVVDNKDNPSMFIIFHDSQACPEYLITFK